MAERVLSVRGCEALPGGIDGDEDFFMSGTFFSALWKGDFLARTAHVGLQL